MPKQGRRNKARGRWRRTPAGRSVDNKEQITIMESPGTELVPSEPSSVDTTAPMLVRNGYIDRSRSQSADFYFKLPSDDILMELFVVVGSPCLRCEKTTESKDDMVLCHRCQQFICLECVLEGCCLQGQESTNQNNKAHRPRSRKLMSDYVHVCSTSTESNLEGREIQLEMMQYQPTRIAN